ncbi:MAG: FAD-dependent oxidoreductase [Chloroflexota bacterium]
MKVKYLIIGNSAGGIGAAEAIRQAGDSGSILIISEEPYPAYSRPLISEYLADGCSLERILFRPVDFYERNGIQTILGAKVEQLDVDEHLVRLGDGRVIAWEKLLLATGGVPIVPPMGGADRPGVFTFTTLDDAKAIGRSLNGSERAVVIGGGLIGVSVAEALVKRGVGVSVVEMKERILNTILDETASALAADALGRAGVDIITGHTVAEIVGDSARGAASGVTLDDGSGLAADLVIVAIGVRPRTEMVADNGIQMNRGIAVSRRMATSQPDVYACGDVAEAYDFVYGDNRLTPIWPNAYLGGRVAGFNMAGIPAEYPGGTAMNALKYFGLSIVSAGVVNCLDNGYEVLAETDGSTYRKVVLQNGVLVGMVFTGDIEKAGIVLSLMQDRINTDGFKQVFIGVDFGLASLPEEVWRTRLEASPSGLDSSAVS